MAARLPPPAEVPGDLAGYGLLAHAPGVLRAFADLYGRLWRDGIVDQPTKEVVRLRNARITDCGYCRSVRFAGAREQGLTETDVAMIDDAYATSTLSSRRKAAIAFADVVLGRAAGVDAGLAASLGREFSPPELVELAVTAALCRGFSKIAVALGPPPSDLPVAVVPSPVPPEAR
jgi:AhpD family alkylhydroperoxidase